MAFVTRLTVPARAPASHPGGSWWPWAPRLDGPPTYYVARWTFMRALGLIYLIAFVSLWCQVDGLVGRDGILPAHTLVERVRQDLGPGAFFRLPTLFWMDASDWTLHLAAGAGAALSVVCILDVLPLLALPLLWMLYLSFLNVCSVWLGYQWDILLMEVGFLAIFAAPLHVLPGREVRSPPSRMVVLLFWWLLFRLMFSSGVVKLASDDAAWWKLLALDYHYYTQPIPTPVSWWIHQMPSLFHRASVLFMFFIEIIVPFALFVPGPVRVAAAGLQVLLQVLIMATGNYCFFNLLTLALCLWSVEDRWWPRRWRRWAGEPLDSAPSPFSGRMRDTFYEIAHWPHALVLPVALVMVPLSAVEFLDRFGHDPWPTWLRTASKAVGPFHITSSYGLFSWMTTRRPEIVVEGSRDGATWREYEFRYKPGDLRRVPPFVAPHQPRLDWQMWFAAGDGLERTPWFPRFCQRLLSGSRPVLALLARDPFPGAPPRYVRALLYEYHFTDWTTGWTEGTWWRRELKGAYSPVMSLR